MYHADCEGDVSEDIRIATAEVVGSTTLHITWIGGARSAVDLADSILSGGDTLAPLRDPALFSLAEVGDTGAAVTWDGGEGDLSIDAVHLSRLSGQSAS